MQILDLIEQIYKETGVLLNRSRIYYYDRMGLLGNIERDDSNYREFDREDYFKIKTIVILSDLDIGLDLIDKILKRDTKTTREVLDMLQAKSSNLAYIINRLNLQI